MKSMWKSPKSVLRSVAIETLEDRNLFAGTAVIALGPNNLYFNAVKGQTQTYDLRVQNTGTGRLLLDAANAFRVRGDDAAVFKVINFPSTGRSIGAGGTINVTVQFSPTSGGGNNIKSALLRVQSNDPKHPIRFVPLRGMPTNGTGGSSEPSLQRIFDLYNLPIKSGETDVNNYHFPTTQPTDTDEILNVSTFVKAGAGNVTVAPLGVFTNAATPAVRMGYYTPGERDSEQDLWYVSGETSQSVNPFYFGNTKFDPGTAEFGLVTEYPNFVNSDRTVRKVYSENTLNQIWSDSSTYRHFRVYPYIAQNGQTVANAYIVAQEEYEVTNVADNNDLIFVVTNVKPATASPTISVQNVSAYPDDETLVFNKIGTPNADVGNLVRTSNTLSVRNTGTSPLTINSSVSGEYSITSGGGNATLAPGEKRNIVVNFTATSGTSIHTGALTITSNDTANPTVTIALSGKWQQFSEQAGPGQPSVEPTAQQIVNGIFGYTTVLTNNGQTLDNGGNVRKVGDEVQAEYFTAADTSGAVRIVELATFHAQTFTDTNGDEVATNSYLGWYQKGSPSSTYSGAILTDKKGTGQMILPTSSSNANITAATFFPGTKTFGFVVEKRTPDSTGGGGEYSDYSLNTFNAAGGTRTEGQFLRFFPARDKNGILIPNTYLVLHDYNRQTTNFDFNDNVYLISNIIPEGAVKQPPTAYAVRNATGVKVSFTSPTDGPRITGFNVYRSTTPTGAYALLNGTPIEAHPSNSYQDDTAVAGTTYYYAVESISSSGPVSQRTMVKV